jgi:polysaccharide biosynthesis/export protein
MASVASLSKSYRRTPASGQSPFRIIVTLLLFVVLNSMSAKSQQQMARPAPPSDLAEGNLNRVAASAPQIEDVLQKEPGLMVELKRWIAKEATDHGQMVDDHEMTDQGVFDRLDTDIKFRAAATRILQRYGYLLPRLNPDSQLARDQAFQIQLQQRQQLQSVTGQYPSSLPSTQAPATGMNPATPTGTPNLQQLQPAQPPSQYGPAPSMPMAPSQPEQPSIPSTQPNFAARQVALQQVQQGQQGLQGLQGEDLSSLTMQPGGMGSSQPSSALTSSMAEGAQGQLPASSDALFASSPFVALSGLSGLSSLSGSLGSSLLSSSYDLGAMQEQSRMAAEYREQGLESPAPPETAFLRQPSGYEYYRKPLSQLVEQPVRAPIVHRGNPYMDVPSLYDLYAQVSPHSPTLQRFGMDVFQNSISDTSQLPMDLPAGPDYVVGPGDGLSINLWGGTAQRLYRIVDREGRLALPEVGPISVSGQTLGQVQEVVQRVLRTEYRDVSADVSLARLRTVRVYVVGDVQHPGAYDISSLSTPLNALFAAGGPTSEGSLRLVRHYRGEQLVEQVDMYDLLLHGVRSDLHHLESGDTVLVPPVGPQVKVEGMVRRPAIYELKGEKTLEDVLALAGGILPTAALRHIEVQRVQAHQDRTMISLNVSDMNGSEDVTRQLESFKVQDGDDIRIFPIAPYNQNAVYLVGHVLRPGRYSFHPGMKLTDLISSYGDLLPEPSTRYAEIVRLNPPDFRPSVESFDLGAALKNPAQAPELQPLDTIRIYGRYDFENTPVVTVGGEVRDPGAYQTSGEAHFRDAIYQAGGLSPDASMDTAQLVRSLPDGQLKIMSIDMRRALAGDPSENLILEPRDRIVVQKNPSKVDPPSVYVKGEVGRPGRFPLTANLHVKDLIQLAGGLKRSAYSQTADLTRFDVHDRNQKIGEHYEIHIAAALAGDSHQNLLLRDGDVLTIRQIPGWNDIGASVTVQGEVEHPGTYGIAPGEKLSSVLKRAGGFLPTAYPQAAVLEREDVRELQQESRQELIQRVEQNSLDVNVGVNESAGATAQLQQAAAQQRQRILEGLRSAPISGRLVIHLDKNLSSFAHSPDDIEMRNGDSITIPKRPDFVVVAGQVYNSNAITYTRNKNADWYLRRAGGVTDMGNRKAIFIVRADGSVVSGNESRWWSGDVLSVRVQPGDTIVVPEKPIGGSLFWKNVIQMSQIASSAAIVARIVVP